MKLTGGHILWHEALPRWLSRLESRAEVEAAIVTRAESLAHNFAGQVYSWNVVNEALNPREREPGGFRRSPLYAMLGKSYVDFAFHAARAADPSALLVYNDFDVELDLPEHAAKRSAVLGLLDMLAASGAPIQAVGIQSHLYALDRFDAAIFRGFLREIAARGLKILITELDVRDVDLPTEIARRDAAVADAYERFLTTALDEPAVSAVVTWGLSDRYTWLTGEEDRKFARNDGLPERPLPFDAGFRPKPAFDSMMRAFKNAPFRS
jgi:endo-1,4-beta-xylanase